MNTLFKMQFGSHVYGTNLPTSDTDYKGIYCPSPRDLLMGTTKESINESTRSPTSLKNSPSDIDTEYFSLKKYMNLLLQGQPVALTMLFSPPQHILQTSPIYTIIVTNRQRFLHKNITPFIGYCRQQANKYGIKGSRVAAARGAMEFFAHMNPTIRLSEIWPTIAKTFTGIEHCELLLDETRGNNQKVRMLSVCNRKVQEHVNAGHALKIYKHLFNEYGQRALEAETNKNVDWKALMHALRVTIEAKQLLQTHQITYPNPQAHLLLSIRKGELTYSYVAAVIEEHMADLEKAQQSSILPDRPDHEFANDLVYNYYLDHVISNVPKN